MRGRYQGSIQGVTLWTTIFGAAVLGPLSAIAGDAFIDGAEKQLTGAAAQAIPNEPGDSPSQMQRANRLVEEEPVRLDEVLVTAQKRSERLEDIPVAAQVVSSQALVAANVADLSDLNNLVPSVQLNGTINGRVPTGIRGISTVSSEGTVGISSGVAVMIDGVPVPSDSLTPTTSWVLRALKCCSALSRLWAVARLPPALSTSRREGRPTRRKGSRMQP